MKRILAIVLLLGLSGCTGGGGIVSGQPDSVKQIQNAAVVACRFLPTAKFIADLLLSRSGNSILSTAETIAGEICNAVTNRPLADGPGDRVPRVRGLRVRGSFVK